MSNVVHTNDAEFQQLISSEQPVLVNFWAEWCGPCKALGPILETLADEFAGKVTIAKMDVDSNTETPVAFGIRSIPTLILFKNGEAVETLVGLMTQAQLSEFLNQHI